MKRRKGMIVLAACLALAYPAYWLTTEGMILYCAKDLTRTSHGCCSLFWNSGHETQFLIRMGRRSVAPIVRQINRPDVSLGTKVHLAWILSSLGDHTNFPVFIGALRSDSPQTRYIAVCRMRDFPKECLRSLPDILDAGTKPQHYDYWILLSSLAEYTSMDKKDKRTLLDINRYQTNGLSREQAALLASKFEISNRGEQRRP